MGSIIKGIVQVFAILIKGLQELIKSACALLNCFIRSIIETTIKACPCIFKTSLCLCSILCTICTRLSGFLKSSCISLLCSCNVKCCIFKRLDNLCCRTLCTDKVYSRQLFLQPITNIRKCCLEFIEAELCRSCNIINELINNVINLDNYIVCCRGIGSMRNICNDLSINLGNASYTELACKLFISTDLLNCSCTGSCEFINLLEQLFRCCTIMTTDNFIDRCKKFINSGNSLVCCFNTTAKATTQSFFVCLIKAFNECTQSTCQLISINKTIAKLFEQCCQINDIISSVCSSLRNTTKTLDGLSKPFSSILTRELLSSLNDVVYCAILECIGKCSCHGSIIASKVSSTRAATQEEVSSCTQRKVLATAKTLCNALCKLTHYIFTNCIKLRLI